MAAKIGILGESTSITGDTTTTVYTVPADKAARIRVLCVLDGVSNTGYSVLIGSPGSQTHISRSTASSGDVWTGLSDAAGTIQSDTIGFQDPGAGVISPNSNNDDHFFLPFPHDFYLSTGDTVRFHIKDNSGGSIHLFQVIGVEDDA
jgi:hypothetical protein